MLSECCRIYQPDSHDVLVDTGPVNGVPETLWKPSNLAKILFSNTLI